MKLTKNIKLYLLSWVIFVLLLLIIGVNLTFAQEENLNVFDRWIEWSDGDNMLINHLNKQAFNYLDIRDRKIAKLKTKADWLKRQKEVKEILMTIVGPFPEKTPLNPRVTGIVQKDGYRIEKVVYESMPDFYVTACLFIPNRIVGKTPAIIYYSGHGNPVLAFRKPSNQTVILNLVKKGFIVFAIDPVVQGERVEYYDPEMKAAVILGKPYSGSTSGHSYVGNQAFISGVSLARYCIWDGIRGIDYLITRSEVDKERIGVVGLSGGGTQTSYLSAFDERVKAAVPCCYITGFRRLLEALGPQDAEQNFFKEILSGITHADFIELRAPKPTLIVTTTRDYFSIQGARETYKEAKRAYKAYGKEENLNMIEDDFGHGYTRKNREGIYEFFQKAFNFPGSNIDEDVELLEPEELHVTPTGQLSTSLGGETVFSHNKKFAQKLIGKIEESRRNIQVHLDKVRKKAKELSGYAVPYDECEPVFRGRYQRDGYSVEMYALRGEGDYVIPLLLMIPDRVGKFPAVIYIHPKGKSAEASPGGQIEELVKKGFIVAAPDILGIGETANKSGSYIHGPAYESILIGRSVVGIQAGDIVRVVNFLKTRSEVEKDKIGAVAIDAMCPALLHAAVFDKTINGIALLNSLISYKSIVMNRFYKFDFSSAVAGALTTYDLPDLVGCIAPRKLLLAELKDEMNVSASEALIDQELAFPRSVYSFKIASENLKVMPYYESLGSIIDWCFE